MVVTGAGRGIGHAVAVGAARRGAPVAVLYRSRPDNAARVVREIEAFGGRAIAVGVDIADRADVARAFSAVDAAFGSVSGLVNNAVLAGPPRRFAALPPEELESVFRTNVFGTAYCTREAAERMSTSNGGPGGAIVMLSSAHAVTTGAPGNWVHFAASKAAVETMARGLAKEFAPDGIRVNVVRPGVIDTETRRGQPEAHLRRVIEQVPLGRMGEPGEAAAAVLWLLSPDASYVSGATVDVSGGL